MNRRHATRAAAVLLAPLLAAAIAIAPAVTRARAQASSAGERPVGVKVEPPNWFIGHTWNPVRLLVRGRHLTAARITASAPGVAVGRVHANGNGDYVFADVTIDARRARPGPVALTLSPAGGSTEVPFELKPRLPTGRRFQGFSEDDVIYLVRPDRFADGDSSNDDPPASAGLFDRSKPRFYHGGDLRGIIQHLPYLRGLGVTAIWMTPIYDNSNRLTTADGRDEAFTDYHGYGPVDFYAVEEHLGDLDILRELVDAAHAEGLKVIQDQVANHTGPGHPWVNDPPTLTWFNGTPQSHLVNRFDTHLLMDPHAPLALKRPTLEGWFAGILPDLNQHDEDVERYLIQNALWWVGTAGFDGIREDTVPYVPRNFWSAWSRALQHEYPRLRIVGEVMDSSSPLVAFYQGGTRQFDGVDTGIGSVFDYPLYFAIRRTFAHGDSIRNLVEVLDQDYLYADANLLVTLLGSHDVARFMSEPGATSAGLRLAATFLFTTRGIPEWYYGDEIGMRGGADPDNRRDFPGGWPADRDNAFEPSGRTADQQAVFQHVRSLLRLRRDLVPLRRGRLVHLAVGDQTYAYARIAGADAAIVVLNNGPASEDLDIDTAPLGLADGETLRGRLALLSTVRVRSGRLRVELPARSAEILTR